MSVPRKGEEKKSGIERMDITNKHIETAFKNPKPPSKNPVNRKSTITSFRIRRILTLTCNLVPTAGGFLVKLYWVFFEGSPYYWNPSRDNHDDALCCFIARWITDVSVEAVEPDKCALKGSFMNAPSEAMRASYCSIDTKTNIDRCKNGDALVKSS